MTAQRTADVVVVGAGIAGVSTAFHLSVRHGVAKVTLVDPRPPLTLTSDKSTECYRNWWPNRPMVGLMNRSIDIFEELAAESNNAFGLSRRGYLFVTAQKEQMQVMLDQAGLASSFGGGAVRTHPGPADYGDSPDGVDILGPAELAEHFPYITDSAIGGVHVRRAGWFSAQQLGAWMLDQAREAGTELVIDEVVGISVDNGSVTGVTLADGSAIRTPVVVNAAGPLSARVGSLAAVDLPLFSELHLKVAFRDHHGVIPRDAPMIIWSDTQEIGWTPEERTELSRMGRNDLLGTMPIFCHGRPEGSGDSPYFLALWEYHREVLEPIWPLPDDPLYPEAVMRGLTTMVPGLNVYEDGLPESTVDGGYYTKTRENRPLIGPGGPEGFHLMTGMSGFGIMVSAGAADLAARHIVGAPLPDYAEAFLLSRYDDPGYIAEIEAVEDSGQL
ncbi:MAG: FAD-binding oxidoreductase [Actinomycetota bacterium]|nr:FAD-binding oxidoreductase [Actinomycetota bacterium]